MRRKQNNYPITRGKVCFAVVSGFFVCLFVVCFVFWGGGGGGGGVISSFDPGSDGVLTVKSIKLENTTPLKAG